MDNNYYRPARFNLLPDVVKNILIINGILFLATVVLANRQFDLIQWLGLHFWKSEHFSAYQFITYMFMHGGFGHIFFNMFAVWMFGAAIENIWGGKRFLIYYLLTGLGAALTHYAVVYFEMQPSLNFINDYLANPDYEKLKTMAQSGVFSSFNSGALQENYNQFILQFNQLVNVDMQAAMNLSVEYMQQLRMDIYNAPVVVGASGAVFGLLLAYGMMFPNSIIYLYFAIPIKAKYFVILYGALELFSGIANIPGDNVAHFAHLGGLLFGLLIIWWWRENGHSDQMYRF